MPIQESSMTQTQGVKRYLLPKYFSFFLYSPFDGFICGRCNPDTYVLTKCESFLLHEADNTDSLEAVEKDPGQIDNDTHGASRVAVDKNTLGQSSNHLYFTHQQNRQDLGRREQL